MKLSLSLIALTLLTGTVAAAELKPKDLDVLECTLVNQAIQPGYSEIPVGEFPMTRVKKEDKRLVYYLEKDARAGMVAVVVVDEQGIAGVLGERRVTARSELLPTGESDITVEATADISHLVRGGYKTGWTVTLSGMRDGDKGFISEVRCDLKAAAQKLKTP